LRYPDGDPPETIFAFAAFRRVAPYIRFTPSTYEAFVPLFAERAAFLRAADIPSSLMRLIVAWLTVAFAFFAGPPLPPSSMLFTLGILLPSLYLYFEVFLAIVFGCFTNCLPCEVPLRLAAVVFAYSLADRA
jgi:hypothetical protein